MEGTPTWTWTDNWSEKQAIFGEALEARAAADLTAYFGAIRRVYRLHTAEIEAGRYEPLFVPWKLLFTPIEREAWEEIQIARLRMFPQYPVLQYFLDFADPWTKVAIECDGKAFHTDVERDLERNHEIRKLGWFIKRVSGKAIWREAPFAGDSLVDERGNQRPPFYPWIDDVIWAVQSRGGTPGRDWHPNNPKEDDE